ncbi:hypothetical protein EG329_006327 [Mollisiaceae sp. DMI_Dod_QoI]|nr:hypothetical protein EG329_006327 [Helotiales sp. DMI_Dod_QoI]
MLTVAISRAWRMYGGLLVDSLGCVYLTAKGYNYFVLDPRVKKFDAEIKAADKILHRLKSELENGGKSGTLKKERLVEKRKSPKKSQ